MAGTDDYTLIDIMERPYFKGMRRYAHLTPEHKRKAVNFLPEWKTGQNLVRNSELKEKMALVDNTQHLVIER